MNTDETWQIEGYMPGVCQGRDCDHNERLHRKQPLDLETRAQGVFLSSLSGICRWTMGRCEEMAEQT